MSTLSKNKINTFARELKKKTTVEFKYNGFYYEVVKSADTGYIVNVYSDDVKDEENDYLDENIIDGGLCTGSARDAIEFML